MYACRLQFAVALCALFSLQNAASANLVISFYEQAGDVWMSLSGTGTVPAGVGNPGSSLQMLNFTDTPFSGVIDTPYGFTNSTLAVTAGGNNLAINGVQFTEDGANQSDLGLSLSGDINENDTYTFSGSAIVTGLTLAQLVTGIYTPLGASGTRGDQDAFAPVTLSISATSVPEPASLAMLSVAVLGGCAAGVTRRRRKHAPAANIAPSLS